MKILMCRPDYFGIEYEINPWMDISKKVAYNTAVNQWNKLHETIEKCGAQIEMVAPVSGWPDMVFTANAGLFYKNKIILPHFKHKERQGELPYMQAWFRKNGYDFGNEITSSTPNYEGAGDSLLAGDILFAGYGFRSDRSFYESEKIFDQAKIIYCELVDPFFYHIDTCFCPLTDKLALWYPHAFSKASQQNMSAAIELIPVVEEEARRFACNTIVLGRHVIMPANCPITANELTKRGFEVHACDMSEFLKAGGACKCLTLRID